MTIFIEHIPFGLRLIIDYKKETNKFIYKSRLYSKYIFILFENIIKSTLLSYQFA